jgi:hypothetical protein
MTLRWRELDSKFQFRHAPVGLTGPSRATARLVAGRPCVAAPSVKREIPGRGCQLDLHGVQLNATTIIADLNHEQHGGIEHIAIETDDYAGALANFKKNGAQILEERVNNGRHVCWVAAPGGAQMELIA